MNFREVRERELKRAGNACEQCQQSDEPLQIHSSDGGSRLRVLCKACHDEQHIGDRMNLSDVMALYANLDKYTYKGWRIEKVGESYEFEAPEFFKPKTASEAVRYIEAIIKAELSPEQPAQP